MSTGYENLNLGKFATEFLQLAVFFSPSANACPCYACALGWKVICLSPRSKKWGQKRKIRWFISVSVQWGSQIVSLSAFSLRATECGVVFSLFHFSSVCFFPLASIKQLTIVYFAFFVCVYTFNCCLNGFSCCIWPTLLPASSGCCCRCCVENQLGNIFILPSSHFSLTVNGVNGPLLFFLPANPQTS